MYVNNVFLFLKNYFLHQHIKTIQKIQNILNFSIKNLNFLETRFAPRSQTVVDMQIDIIFLNIINKNH